MGEVLLEIGEIRLARNALEAGLQVRGEPESGAYNHLLGLVLVEGGHFDAALDRFRSAEKQGPRWKGVEGWVRRVQEQICTANRLVEFESQLEEVSRGEVKIGKAEDDALLGTILRARHEHAAAARHYTAAFARDPSLAAPDKRGWRHRVNAARAAVLAGAGLGNAASGLTLDERARLRGQALAWLEAQFTYLVEDMIPPRDAAFALQPGRYEVLRELRRWQIHSDFADVRDAEGLGRLPAAERERWLGLWHRVEAAATMFEGVAQ